MRNAYPADFQTLRRQWLPLARALERTTNDSAEEVTGNVGLFAPRASGEDSRLVAEEAGIGLGVAQKRPKKNACERAQDQPDLIAAGG